MCIASNMVFRIADELSFIKNITRVHQWKLNSRAFFEMLCIIALDFLAWKFHIVDPAVLLLQQYKAGCKRNGKIGLQVFCELAEIVGEILFAYLSNFHIVFAFVADLIREIACPTPAGKQVIYFLPSRADLS